jgi:hypothetical protein
MKSNTISHLNLGSSTIINWNNIIKKEARSITNDVYLGSIQGLCEPFIVVEEKGVLNQKRHFIPKDLLEGYDDIAVYFRTEGINSIIITDKEEEDPEKEELRKNNNCTNVIVFDRTSLPVKKAKETAIELKEVLHPVVIAAEEYAMKFTKSFKLTVLAKIKGITTAKGEELKGVYKRLLKLVVKELLKDFLN